LDLPLPRLFRLAARGNPFLLADGQLGDPDAQGARELAHGGRAHGTTVFDAHDGGSPEAGALREISLAKRVPQTQVLYATPN